MMERNTLPVSLFSRLSGLRDGDSDSAKLLKYLLSSIGFEFHSRAIVGSAKVCWVVDIPHYRYLQKGFLSVLDSELRWLNAIQTSLNDWLESGRRTLLYSFAQSRMKDMREGPPEDSSEPSIPSYVVAVSTVVLLSLVYQYLSGHVDWGGSKAYSRTSLDFRDIYVAIVLFLGAYVWIKFREVAFKGVHRREVPNKQAGTKVVYEARLKPPMWNGEKVPRLDLGRFATPQEAHNKFLIAAFYYNRDAGLLDGWFQVPPMSEEERSLTGKEKRKWVTNQAGEVYKEFKKQTAEAKEKEEAALLVQDLFDVWDDQLTPEQHEVNVDFSMVSLLNSTEPQQSALVNQAENSGMGIAMLDNDGLEWASHSFDEMHEGLALPNDHSLASQEGFALPVSQRPPNAESGMNLNSNDQLDSLQTLVHTLQQQISLQQRQIQELGNQNLQLQHQQRIQQQQLQEIKIRNPQ